MVVGGSQRVREEKNSRVKKRMCSMLFRYLWVLMVIFGLLGSFLLFIKSNNHYYFCLTGETNFLESMLFFFAALTSLVLERYESEEESDEEYKRYIRVYRIPAALAVFYFIYEFYSLVLCICC